MELFSGVELSPDARFISKELVDEKGNIFDGVIEERGRNKKIIVGLVGKGKEE